MASSSRTKGSPSESSCDTVRTLLLLMCYADLCMFHQLSSPTPLPALPTGSKDTRVKDMQCLFGKHCSIHIHRAVHQHRICCLNRLPHHGDWSSQQLEIAVAFDRFLVQMHVSMLFLISGSERGFKRHNKVPGDCMSLTLNGAIYADDQSAWLK